MALFAPRAKLPIVAVVLAVARDAGGPHRGRFFPLRGFTCVTAFTGHLPVCPVEPEFGPLAVIKVPDGPAAGVVAGLALHAKLQFVPVFLLMAGIAVARGVLVALRFMAASACRGDMATSQRKARQAVVESGGLPTPVAVALTALLALRAFVLVVFFVTAVTVQRRLAKAFLVLVTRGALQHPFGMGIAKHKAGLVMIEPSRGGFPVPFGVAVRTLLSEGELVPVVFLVTSVAILGCIPEHGTPVTILALHLGVLAQQRKAGLSVVEPWWLFPAALTVATATVLAQ